MRVTSSGQYYIDVHDADGRTVESILLPQDSRYDQPTMDEGTHYYAKVYDTDQPPLVGIYRRTVTDGESVDHHWSSLEASWIRSAWLLPYAVGRGEEPLRAISERAAVYIIERLRVRTESLHLARVVGPGVYFFSTSLTVTESSRMSPLAFDVDAPSAAQSREWRPLLRDQLPPPQLGGSGDLSKDRRRASQARPDVVAERQGLGGHADPADV